MKKSILLLTAMMLTTVALKAQKLPFTYKKSYLTLGYGFPNYFSSQIPTYDRYFSELGGDLSSSCIGPFVVAYENARSEHIGLGLMLTYDQSELDYQNLTNSSFVYSSSYMDISFRFSWHPWIIKKWDPYFAGTVGYAVINDESYDDPNSYKEFLNIQDRPDWSYSVMAGVRYFSPPSSVGFFVEAGYSKSHLIKAGIAFRIGPSLHDDGTPW